VNLPKRHFNNMQSKSKMMKIAPFIILFVFNICILPPSIAFADYSLQFLYTIKPSLPYLDSTEVKTIMPIGDFNADGYEDLAVGIVYSKRFYQDTSLYEAVWIYYGGPSFDTIPDLKIQGPKQYQGGSPFAPGFGTTICGLGDFNGDGYDDIAVAAPGWDWNAGRIYIYFGGPNPDTTADLVVYNHQGYDQFGTYMQCGDFNGDGLGDLLTGTIDHYNGQRVFIYLGASPPDTVYDALFDYSGTQNWVGFQAGFDINGDGFGDFELGISGPVDSYILLFLGQNPIPLMPSDTLRKSYINFPGDISLDGIDDFIMPVDTTAYLFLGGNPVDFYPDYPWPRNIGGGLSIYNFVGQRKLLTDRYFAIYPNIYEQLELFNLGVPIDSIPLANFNCDDIGFEGHANIGDINTDGTDEIALLNPPMGYSDNFIKIYQIIYANSINDSTNSLPKDIGILKAYPNPFNSSTEIIINNQSNKKPKQIISIYDILGRPVKEFEIDTEKGGISKIIWDATNISGEKVSSGIYFAKVSASTQKDVLKLIYLK
jgi:hypothetical protein